MADTISRVMGQCEDILGDNFDYRRDELLEIMKITELREINESLKLIAKCADSLNDCIYYGIDRSQLNIYGFMDVRVHNKAGEE